MPTRRKLIGACTLGVLGMTAAFAGDARRLVERFDRLHVSGALEGVHGVIIRQRGRTLLERYLPGEDEAWGQPLGRVAFGPDALNDMRSVTKSIVAVLYGIALSQGRVAPPEARRCWCSSRITPTSPLIRTARDGRSITR